MYVVDAGLRRRGRQRLTTFLPGSSSRGARRCHETKIAKAPLVFKDGVRPFAGPAVSANWVRKPLNVGYTLCLVSLCPVLGVCRHCSLDGDGTGGWVTILSRYAKWGGQYRGHVVGSSRCDRGLDHELRGIHRPEHT